MGGEVRKKVREKGKGEREGGEGDKGREKGLEGKEEKWWREGEDEGEGREIENRKVMRKKEEEEAEVDKKQQLYIAGLLCLFLWSFIVISFKYKHGHTETRENTHTQKDTRNRTHKQAHKHVMRPARVGVGVYLRACREKYILNYLYNIVYIICLYISEKGMFYTLHLLWFIIQDFVYQNFSLFTNIYFTNFCILIVFLPYSLKLSLAINSNTYSHKYI